MTIHVVGGVYREHCVHPRWNRIYGSAGRAALAIAHLDTPVALHSYMDEAAREAIADEAAWLNALELNPLDVPTAVEFRYMHDMGPPDASGVPLSKHPPIQVSAEKVVRFDMLEGDAVVTATWAVYDPQGVAVPRTFAANGSSARHLALVLNSSEAAVLSGMPSAPPSEAAARIARQQGAEVVVIKLGPLGAYVWTADDAAQVPAFRTPNVWKIGSGDCFVAHFANAWMQEGKTPVEAAEEASRATAYYCENRALPTKQQLANYKPLPVEISNRFLENGPRQVYLAGPFFDLAQLWLIEEARRDLDEVGLKVFSPYHDVGLGSAEGRCNERP